MVCLQTIVLKLFAKYVVIFLRVAAAIAVSGHKSSPSPLIRRGPGVPEALLSGETSDVVVQSCGSSSEIHASQRETWPHDGVIACAQESRKWCC